MDTNRKVVAELETADGQTARFDGLNIKFDIHKNSAPNMNRAKVDIANLSMDRIYSLTTLASPYEHEQKQKKLRLYAGYVKGGETPPLIFAGEITGAVPTMPPDIWLNMEARTGFYNNQKVVSLSLNGKVKYSQICALAAGQMGVSLNYLAQTNKNVQGFSHNGGVTQVVEKINQLGGIIVFEDDGDLVALDAQNPNRGTTPRVVNSQSGMVGMPIVTNVGLKLKMLLDPAIRVGDRIRLESTMLREANGEYWCYALTHKGSLRGTEFYTELEVKRL